MAVEWLRLWHDMPNDPKWRTIAKVSGRPIALVLSIYTHLLVDASRNSPRGQISLTVEDIASALDADDDDVAAVLEAMQGRVRDGNQLTGWSRRQPKREDVGNPETGALSGAERKRKMRAARQGTQRNAMERIVPTDKEKETETEKELLKPIGSNVTEGAPLTQDAVVAMTLFAELRQDMPTAKEPNFDAWANDIRLMRTVDNLTHDEITQAWRYARNHGFWRNKIRCPERLRKEYGRLKRPPPPPALMPKDWRPNPESLGLLARQGIPATFLEDLVPEFELYWRERRGTSDNWDKVFRHHARTSWTRHKSAPPPQSKPHPLPRDWKPAPEAYEALREAGIDPAFGAALVSEFVLYWSESRQAHTAWNAKFVNHVNHRWTSRSVGKATRDLTLEEQLHDRSWSEPVPERRAGVN